MACKIGQVAEGFSGTKCLGRIPRLDDADGAVSPITGEAASLRPGPCGPPRLPDTSSTVRFLLGDTHGAHIVLATVAESVVRAVSVPRQEGATPAASGWAAAGTSGAALRAGDGAVQHGQRERQRERGDVQHPGHPHGHPHPLDQHLRLRDQRPQCPGLRRRRQPLRRQRRRHHGEQGDARRGGSASSPPGSTSQLAWPSTPPATSTSPTTAAPR